MRITLICTLAGIGLASAAAADSHAPAYSAKDLMKPCFEADSDARNGVFAETECEQYMLGFVGALAATGTGEGICLPEQNVADEVRWAFIRWVHESFSQRTGMAASDAVLETLKANFPCN